MMARTFGSLIHTPKKRIAACLILLLFAVFTFIVFSTVTSRLEREIQLEEMIADQQSHLDFLQTQYQGRQEDVINLQNKMSAGRGAVGNISRDHTSTYTLTTTVTPEILAILRNMSGTRAAAGIHTRSIHQLRIPFVYQLLPHLMQDPFSLKPAYHMRGDRTTFSDIVVGIPSVKRDMESYLMVTLTHLLDGMTAADEKSTMIIVMIGETNLEYVLQTARQIETKFPTQVRKGTIEVISPSPAYYPDFESLPNTLGDSHKRVKWRTKQNLDTIYLMAYAQSKGTYYLMLEDDVIAKKNYIQEIKHFTAVTTVANPDWLYIQYCHVGGIGKLFRSADLTHFITYVQLFYNNMPIDWLLESYLADKVCTIYKSSKGCAAAKLKIRPKFNSSLFQHIGLYSSLKGKIQKIKDTKFGIVPTYYPHANPPLRVSRTDIEEHSDHSLQRAYDGHTYFWGITPKKGDVVEFWFQKPTNIARYSFRSGNVDHVSDKFYDTTVEVLKSNSLHSNFTMVGSFDEFGMAEGDLKMGSIVAIRLKVNKNSTYWVILSEIELKEAVGATIS